nr:MAG TPA: hypothetical protein [Inoviridae sp.]
MPTTILFERGFFVGTYYSFRNCDFSGDLRRNRDQGHCVAWPDAEICHGQSGYPGAPVDVLRRGWCRRYSYAHPSRLMWCVSECL